MWPLIGLMDRSVAANWLDGLVRGRWLAGQTCSWSLIGWMDRSMAADRITGWSVAADLLNWAGRGRETIKV